MGQAEYERIMALAGKMVEVPPKKDIIVLTEPIDLDEEPLQSEDYVAVDEALNTGLELVFTRAGMRSSLRIAVIEDPERPEVRYGGFGTTAETALRRAVVRMRKGEQRVEYPADQVATHFSHLLQVDRSPFDALLNDSLFPVHVRRFSPASEDPVVIATNGKLLRGSNFSEACASVPTSSPPMQCGQ